MALGCGGGCGSETGVFLFCSGRRGQGRGAIAGSRHGPCDMGAQSLSWAWHTPTVPGSTALATAPSTAPATAPGRPEVCSEGGRGGLSSPRMVWEVQEPSLFVFAQCRWWKNFLKKGFTPFVYVQNDQRVMGIILRHVCWGTHRPPPPPPAPSQTPAGIVSRQTREPMAKGGGWENGLQSPPPPPSTQFSPRPATAPATAPVTAPSHTCGRGLRYSSEQRLASVICVWGLCPGGICRRSLGRTDLCRSRPSGTPLHNKTVVPASATQC